MQHSHWPSNFQGQCWRGWVFPMIGRSQKKPEYVQGPGGKMSNRVISFQSFWRTPFGEHIPVDGVLGFSPLKRLMSLLRWFTPIFPLTCNKVYWKRNWIRHQRTRDIIPCELKLELSHLPIFKNGFLTYGRDCLVLMSEKAFWNL